MLIVLAFVPPCLLALVLTVAGLVDAVRRRLRRPPHDVLRAQLGAALHGSDSWHCGCPSCRAWVRRIVQGGDR